MHCIEYQLPFVLYLFIYLFVVFKEIDKNTVYGLLPVLLLVIDLRVMTFSIIYTYQYEC